MAEARPTKGREKLTRRHNEAQHANQGRAWNFITPRKIMVAEELTIDYRTYGADK